MCCVYRTLLEQQAAWNYRTSHTHTRDLTSGFHPRMYVHPWVQPLACCSLPRCSPTRSPTIRCRLSAAEVLCLLYLAQEAFARTPRLAPAQPFLDHYQVVAQATLGTYEVDEHGSDAGRSCCGFGSRKCLCHVHLKVVIVSRFSAEYTITPPCCRIFAPRS